MSVSPSPHSRSNHSKSPRKSQDRGNGARKSRSSSSRSARRSPQSERGRSRSKSYSKGSDKGRDYRRKSGSEEGSQGNVLYITNLSSRVKESKLEDKFSRYGNVTRVHLVKDPYTKFENGKLILENQEDLGSFTLRHRRKPVMLAEK